MTGLRWSRELVSVKRKGAIWIMVGRPRKIGKRKPCGRLAPVYVNPKAQVARQPHRQSVPKKCREWPEAESEFGRSLLRGAITPAQHAAGMRFTELSVALCAVYDVPSPYPHAMDLTRVRGAMGPGMPSDVATAIRSAYGAAFEACAKAGRKPQRAVKDCVVLDRAIGDFETLRLVRLGLDELVRHFGIDPKLELDRRVRITSCA
jgi:hypothetical protein